MFYTFGMTWDICFHLNVSKADGHDTLEMVFETEESVWVVRDQCVFDPRQGFIVTQWPPAPSDKVSDLWER